MFIEKSHDTDTMSRNVIVACKAAIDSCDGYIDGLWVQTYIDFDGYDETETWDISLSKVEPSFNLLTKSEIEGMRALMRDENYDDTLTHMLHIINRRWNDKYAIRIENTYMPDIYSFYGVTREQFA